MTTVPQKTCTKCGEAKPRTDFGKDRARGDGLAPWCRACKSAHYRETKDDYARRYDEKRDQHNERRRAWRAANPEAARAADRAYYQTHKEDRANTTHLRRARQWNAECGCVTHLDIIYLQALPCTYCGAPFEHMDHVMPLAKGGPHCLSNLTPSCVPCNLAKSDTVLDDPPQPILHCTKISSE